MFRRGTPYLSATPDGGLDQVLHFVGFEADLAVFTTILNRLILNAGFSGVGTGPDALIDPARGLVTVLSAGFYFALPHDDRFLGVGMFDADTRDCGLPAHPQGRPRHSGRGRPDRFPGGSGLPVH